MSRAGYRILRGYPSHIRFYHLRGKSYQIKAILTNCKIKTNFSCLFRKLAIKKFINFKLSSSLRMSDI